MSEPRYDVIVLGSGISGLTAACLLAKVRKQKILLLEQHSVVGGFTHTFRRGPYEWDTGLHYVGHMGEKDFPRWVMDYLTDQQVDWARLPESFEHFHFPGFSFAQRAGEKEFTADLIERFPGQRTQIENYFVDLRKAQLWGTLIFASRILPFYLGWIPRLAAWPLRHWGKRILAEYLKERNVDPELAAVLSAPCGDHGLAPSQASFFIHALIVNHYLQGAYYPKGGGGRLPEAIQKHLERLGVRVLTRHRAEEILVERGAVRGVRVAANGQEKVFCAPQVISCVGARQTYGRLLASRHQKSRPSQDILNFTPGMKMLTVYLGLKTTPAQLGFRGENHWLFSSTDFEGMNKACLAEPGEVHGCYLSFPSLKDPSLTSHTAEIMVPTSHGYFQEVSRGGWRRRGADYEHRKMALGNKAVDFVNSRFPGFRELIDKIEVSTPLSVQHFTLHPEGDCYGLPATPARYRLKGLGPRTAVKGLYLAGADVFAHGIVGAMTSAFCVCTVMGYPWQIPGLFRAVFSARKASSYDRHPQGA